MITIKDFGEHVCGPRMLVREVLARIDASQYLFQIVLGDDGRLLGTITDGAFFRSADCFA